MFEHSRCHLILLQFERVDLRSCSLGIVFFACVSVGGAAGRNVAIGEKCEGEFGELSDEVLCSFSNWRCGHDLVASEQVPLEDLVWG